MGAQLSRAHVRYPKPEAIREALAGGPPVRAADLRAVVVDELDRLRHQLHTSDTTPWKRYWNLDSTGHPEGPLPENQCRDHLLDLLKVVLRPYRIAGALPEARRGEETRADMLIMSCAGRDLPIEAKRHYNRDIWTAPRAQLQGYANSERAEGFGIYLVFWFGNDQGPTAPREDGAPGPNTAGELEAMLAAEVPPESRELMSIIVFDVSNPSGPAGKPRTRCQRKAGIPSGEGGRKKHSGSSSSTGVSLASG